MDHAFTLLDWHMLLIHPAGMDAEVVFMFVERCGLRVGDQRELGTPGPLLPVSRLGRQSVTHLFDILLLLLHWLNSFLTGMT